MALTTGQVTVGTSEVQVIATSPRTSQGVVIKAHVGNSAICYLGVTGLDTTDGFELAAGESVTLPYNKDVGIGSDADEIFAISGSAAQTVSFLTF